jgi:hypothetical protein
MGAPADLLLLAENVRPSPGQIQFRPDTSFIHTAQLYFAA